MDTKELLGKRVRELRKKRGLTLEKLSELAGIDVKFLGGIERGKENPSIGTLEKLAIALSVRLHQVLTLEHQVRGEKVLRKKITQILETCTEGELQIIFRLVSVIKE